LETARSRRKENRHVFSRTTFGNISTLPFSEYDSLLEAISDKIFSNALSHFNSNSTHFNSALTNCSNNCPTLIFLSNANRNAFSFIFFSMRKFSGTGTLNFLGLAILRTFYAHFTHIARKFAGAYFMRIKCGTMSYAFRSNLCGSRYEKKRTPRSDSAQRLQKESCRTGRTQTAFNLWLIRRFDRRRSTARRRKAPQRHAAPRVNESSTGSLDALEHFFAARSRAPQPCVPLDVGVFPPLDQR
jgi:hypothetical protein